MTQREESIFFVGTYSRPGAYFPHASGEGAVTCALDLDTGVIRRLHACADAVNATYLVRSPDGKTLLVASDLYFDDGCVMAFAITEDGSLRHLSTQSAHGTAVCHVTPDPAGRRVFVSSYWNGRLTAHDLRDGLLSAADPVFVYEGRGPNPERQETAHAHQAIVSPGGRWLHVCDLGSDRIWVHDLHDARLSYRGVQTPAGYGPRHLVHHPSLPLTYVLCELNAHLLTYERNEQTGGLRLVADQPALPADYAGAPSAAAIRLHPSGRTVCVSNRGHDSITVFAIDARTGLPDFAARCSSGGREPRDFNIDPSGRWLITANQNSHTLASIRFDPASGLPTGDRGPDFACGTPVCVAF